MSLLSKLPYRGLTAFLAASVAACVSLTLDKTSSDRPAFSTTGPQTPSTSLSYRGVCQKLSFLNAVPMNCVLTPSSIEYDGITLAQEKISLLCGWKAGLKGPIADDDSLRQLVVISPIGRQSYSYLDGSGRFLEIAADNAYSKGPFVEIQLMRNDQATVTRQCNFDKSLENYDQCFSVPPIPPNRADIEDLARQTFEGCADLVETLGALRVINNDEYSLAQAQQFKQINAPTLNALPRITSTRPKRQGPLLIRPEIKT